MALKLLTFSGGLLDEDDALLNGENVSPELRGGEGDGGRRGRGRRDGIERRGVNLDPLVDAIATGPRRAHGNPPCCYLTHVSVSVNESSQDFLNISGVSTIFNFLLHLFLRELASVLLLRNNRRRRDSPNLP